MGDSKVLCLADNCINFGITGIIDWNKNYFTRNDGVIKHLIDLPYLPLAGFELVGNLSDCVAILDFILF